jgi:hypothetical protein
VTEATAVKFPLKFVKVFAAKVKSVGTNNLF